MKLSAPERGQPVRARQERLAEAVAGTPVAKFGRIRSAPKQGGCFGMTGTVPQNESKDLAFVRPQSLHGPVHRQLGGLEGSDRPRSPPRLRDESLAEAASPHRRPAVVGDHPTGHTEQPESIFWRSGDHRNPAPGDEKYLCGDVLDVVFDDAASHVRGDGLAVGVVERFESGWVVIIDLERSHSAEAHFSSFTQSTWPGQGRIRQLFTDRTAGAETRRAPTVRDAAPMCFRPNRRPLLKEKEICSVRSSPMATCMYSR